MEDKKLTRRTFIKTSAVGVAASALCPAMLRPDKLWAADAQASTAMFCYQCEQTAKGTGCTRVGICGKKPEVAAMQDLLIYLVKGLSVCAVAGRKVGINDDKVNRHACKAMFSTLTNVDFDEDRFRAMVSETVAMRDDLRKRVLVAGGQIDTSLGAVTLPLSRTANGRVAQGKKVGLKSDASIDPDILSLQHTLLFGIKGLCAYTHHARDLGQQDDKIYAFVHEALTATLNKKAGVDELLGLALKCGEMNLRAMELLDLGNTGTYGHPVPTTVPLYPMKGKAILVSGHDLMDLEKILQQSAGKGINVYTHGEMLPCHGYPKLKSKYPHFYGHYGTAWQKQQKEFVTFPGPIVMTTNCIQRPRSSYKGNIFTTGLVGWPEVTHIPDNDFGAVIEKALEMPGFKKDGSGETVTVGFARNSVLGVADKIIQGVKDKKIRHFFLVAGCDGSKPSRSYYTEFVEKVPEDCLVMTLGCGKFKFFDKKLGDIDGIPRLLDVGQCNDAYSAVQIAVALANAFECGVNDLPLSMVLSWYEQKACSILLTLLHLGIKDIRLGPTLPAFMTPNVLNVLIEKFNIMPIKTPDEDLKAILA